MIYPKTDELKITAENRYLFCYSFKYIYEKLILYFNKQLLEKIFNELYTYPIPDFM